MGEKGGEARGKKRVLHLQNLQLERERDREGENHLLCPH